MNRGECRRKYDIRHAQAQAKAISLLIMSKQLPNCREDCPELPSVITIKENKAENSTRMTGSSRKACGSGIEDRKMVMSSNFD